MTSEQSAELSRVPAPRDPAGIACVSGRPHNRLARRYLPDDPVAWHEDAQRIAPNRLTDFVRGGAVSQFGGQLAIGLRLAVADVGQQIPDSVAGAGRPPSDWKTRIVCALRPGIRAFALRRASTRHRRPARRVRPERLQRAGASDCRKYTPVRALPSATSVNSPSGLSITVCRVCIFQPPLPVDAERSGTVRSQRERTISVM